MDKKRQKLKRVMKTGLTEIKHIKLDFDPGWEARHMDAVKPEIDKILQNDMRAIAQAPFIAVSNDTK